MPVGYNYTIGDTVNLHVFKLKLKYKGKIMNVTYFDIWCFSALILYGVLRLVG